MTWDPPKADGLTGDAYPSEQIEAFVDDPADAHRPGVYTLKCSQPAGFETVARRFQNAFDAPAPDWLTDAWAADATFYVGGAKDVFARLEEHAEGTHTPAFCEVFPVHSIYQVEFFDSEDKAFERESGVALQLKSDLPGVHVHQR